jgi:hypothetical protein
MSQHARNNPDQPPLHEAFKGGTFSKAIDGLPFHKMPHSFHYHEYTDDELQKLANLAEKNGWELDTSPATEQSNDIWWRHGGTFALKRERDLFDDLSPLLDYPNPRL